MFGQIQYCPNVWLLSISIMLCYDIFFNRPERSLYKPEAKIRERDMWEILFD